MADNIFDQFDSDKEEEKTSGSENVFDQFDQPEEQPKESSNFMGIPTGDNDAPIDAKEENQKKYSAEEQKNIDIYGTKKFDTSMYEDMTPEESVKVYNDLRNRATEYTWLGEPVINNNIVPTPYSGGITLDGLPAEQDTDWAYSMFSGFRDAGKGAALTGAALLDQLYENTTGTNPRLTESLDDYIANPTPSGSTADSLIRETARVGAGAIAGVALTKKITPDSGIKLISHIAAAVGANLGDVITAPKGSQPLVVGKDSVVQEIFGGTIFEGIPVDKNGSLSKQILQEKLNYLQDQVIVGVGVKTGLNAAEVGLRFIKAIVVDPLIPLFNENAAKSEVIKNIVANANLPPNKENMLRLRDYISQNKDIVFEISDDMANQEKIVLKRTSLSAASEGAKNAGDNILADDLLAAEKGFSKTNEPLERAANQPREVVQDFVERRGQAYGGADSIEQTRSTLAQQGKEAIESNRMNVAVQEDSLNLLKEGFEKRLKSDPILGEDIKKLSKISGISIPTKEKSGNALMKNIQDAASSLQAKNDELWDKLPAEVEINKDSFNEFLKNNRKNLPNGLLQFVRDSGDSLLSYKTMRKELLPEVNKYINNLYNSSGGVKTAELDSLLAFREEITDKQLGYLPNEVKGIVDTANNFWKKEIFPFTNETSPLKDFFETNKMFDSGKLKSIPVEQRYGLEDVSKNTIGMFKDKTPGSSKALVDLLNKSTDPKAKTNLFKYQVGESLKRLSGDIINGDIDKINPSTVLSTFGENAEQLTKEFPKEVKKLTTLINDLKAAKGNIKVQEELLKKVQEESASVEREIYSSALGKFIKGTPTGGVTEVPNGYQVLKNLFADEQSLPVVREITDRVMSSDDELAKRGLKSAYFNYLNEAIFNAKPAASNSNMKKLSSEGLNSLYSYGNEIFRSPEDQKVLDITKGMVDAIMAEDAKKTGVASARPMGNTPNKALQRAQQGANRLVTGVWGPLNRSGSRVRIIVGGILGKTEAIERMTRIQQAILSDPEAAIDALETAARVPDVWTPGIRAVRNEILMRFGINLANPKDDSSTIKSNLKKDKKKMPDGVK